MQDPRPSQRFTLQTWVLAAILASLTGFAPLSIDMYLPSFPTLMREFNAPESSVQATLSVFFIGMAVGQAIYGPVSDRYGRKAPVYGGVLLFIIASIGATFSHSIGELIVWRLLQALGGCVGIVIARAIVRDLFNVTDSARMFSMLLLVLGIAPILAPLFGGQMLLFLGWRAIFVLLALFGVFCLLLITFGLKETLPPPKRNTHSFLLAFSNYGRLLIDPHFMGFALSSGLVSASMFAYIAGSPFVFIELNDVPAEHYGLLFGMNAFGLIGASQVNQRLLSKYSATTLLDWALIANSVAVVTLVIAAYTGIGGFVGLLIPLFIAMATMGFVQPNATATAMGGYGHLAGTAAALLGILQFLVAAVSSSLVGVLHDGTAMPMCEVIAGSALLATITRFTLGRRKKA